jgi:hypothetical protein
VTAQAQARAPGDLLFHWERPRRRKLAIAGFLVLSAALHAFGFYIFQVVYPPPIALLPPPAQVTLIAPTSPEARTFLNWLSAEDPALASQTQRPSDARAFQLPKLAHIPSYVAVKPQLKNFPERHSLPSPPLAFPPNSVEVKRAPLDSPPLKAPTTLVFSNPALILQTPPPDFKFLASTREVPENVRFTIAVDSSGLIRYVFPEHSSGDAALDEQARGHLVVCRFQRLPTASPNDGLIWATAAFEFGNDLQLPMSSTESAP